MAGYTGHVFKLKDSAVKRFSDFAEEEGPLEGGKVQIDSILNNELLFTGYRIKESKYKGKNKSGKCLTIQFEVDGEKRVIFTGSDVLISQFERYGDELPFLAILKKVDNKFFLFCVLKNLSLCASLHR